MNKQYYEPIPLGESIPLNNPYAFSVSMPTIQDVIDYEEGTSESLNVIKSAYPRILFHPYIKKIIEIATDELNLTDYKLFLLPDLKSALCVSGLSDTTPEFLDFHEYTLAIFKLDKKDEIESYYNLMKHCGYMLFDREAEDLLNRLGVKTPEFKEDVVNTNSENIILDVLSDGYGSSNILLGNCGMNVIYAGFEAVKRLSDTKGRKLFILFGWAYSDTIQILKKCTDELVIISDVKSTSKLEDLLNKRGAEVAGIYLETVSNPLIEVPDLPKVYELSKEYNIPLLVDNTFATPWNVDINLYCDLIFESLTKFASGKGDLMAGAVILPTQSQLKPQIMNEIKNFISPLYIRTQNRLAHSIKGYKDRVLKINDNAKTIYNYLKTNDKIKDVFSVYNKSQLQNWNKIAKTPKSFCGVISVVFFGEIAKVYDNLLLPKGPSLGSEFPIIMSYTLLAHYNETKNDEGLKYLKELGMSPDLLRISIGIDDPSFIINTVKKVQ
ncbi:MAG: aminotransferase class I/II-fold pyridoxal phosphate-dependent enzyme [Spirochaetaceae bacterium]